MRLEKFLTFFCSLTLLILFFSMFFNTLSRYLFDFSLIGLQELTVHAMVLFITCSIPLTYHMDKHVKIDIFSRLLSDKAQQLLSIIMTLTSIIAFALLIYFNFDYAKMSWILMESSPESGGLPWLFVIKQCVILLPLLLLLVAAIRVGKK